MHHKAAGPVDQRRFLSPNGGTVSNHDLATHAVGTYELIYKWYGLLQASYSQV
jgi:hypothetical protein